jgi:hypothetical protein
MAIDIDQLRSVISRMEALLDELRAIVDAASSDEQADVEDSHPTPDE